MSLPAIQLDITFFSAQDVDARKNLQSLVDLLLIKTRHFYMLYSINIQINDLHLVCTLTMRDEKLNTPENIADLQSLRTYLNYSIADELTCFNDDTHRGHFFYFNMLQESDNA
jgi:hypothetical protein